MYDSQTGEMILDNDQTMYVGMGIIVLIVIIAVIVKASQLKSSSNSYKDVTRKDFTNSTRESVKEKQNGRCTICRKIPTHWEFDHIDGRGDNSISNCHGLCRDCHQTKTLDDNERHRD